MLPNFTRAHLVMFEGLLWSRTQEKNHLHHSSLAQPTLGAMASHRELVNNSKTNRATTKVFLNFYFLNIFLKLHYSLQGLEVTK